MSEGLVIFLVGCGIGLLNFLLNQLVIKRIDKMEFNIEKKDEVNLAAHEKLWTEHNGTKMILCERVAKLEERVDVAETVKKLLSTT